MTALHPSCEDILLIMRTRADFSVLSVLWMQHRKNRQIFRRRLCIFLPSTPQDGPKAPPAGWWILGLRGCPEPRLTDKPRGAAIIASAGGIPDELRQYCDMATPCLNDLCQLLINGDVVGDLYAGAHYPRDVADHEWSKAYTIRELDDAQLEQAYSLGAPLAHKIQNGEMRPYDAERIAATYAGG